MSATVRTVLGDIPAEQLGATDVHEHLLMRDPVLPGDELDDLDRSTAEAAEARAAGIAALVELTPPGLGRDPEGLRTLARRAGIHVVMATGRHADPHYPAGHWAYDLPADALAELFVAEIADAVRGEDGRGAPLPDVRAGVIKVGVGYWSISPREERALAAAAAAAAATGAPITCHLEHGTAGHEVLDLLEDAGVAPNRVILAHADRNPDPDLHLELAGRGAYLSYDGCGRARVWPDSVLVDCFLAVAAGGGAERLLLGSDRARAGGFHAYGGHPGLAYLPRRFVPRIAAGGGDDLTRLALVDNPARVLRLG
ncbi:MAG: aryldialkylphosphatase [Actinobacteria bacterium]|nr:aryldialkylphosphatase [Actinomycetota bacterium]